MERLTRQIDSTLSSVNELLPDGYFAVLTIQSLDSRDGKWKEFQKIEDGKELEGVIDLAEQESREALDAWQRAVETPMPCDYEEEGDRP